MLKTINAKDPGSLFVGKNEAGIKKGDKIRIKGEDKVRTITYVMGSEAKSNVHLCARDTGPFPVGPQEIEFELVREEAKQAATA